MQTRSKKADNKKISFMRLLYKKQGRNEFSTFKKDFYVAFKLKLQDK